MFTAALFIIAKIQKQPKCPSTDNWIKTMYVCTHTYTGKLLSHKKTKFRHVHHHGWTWKALG